MYTLKNNFMSRNYLIARDSLIHSRCQEEEEEMDSSLDSDPWVPDAKERAQFRESLTAAQHADSVPQDPSVNFHIGYQIGHQAGYARAVEESYPELKETDD